MAFNFSKGNRGFGDISFEQDADTGIDFDEDSISLETNGIARLVVKNAGIGIGTASPDTLVHLKGASPAITLQRNNNVSESSMINFEGQAGVVACQMGQITGQLNQLAFSTHDGNNLLERIRIDNAGKVGIGTSTPDYTLDVAGTMGVDEYIYHNGDSNTYIRFQNDDINFQVGGTSMIKLDKGNNVIKINNANQDIDFKIKDSATNVLFHADAGASRIGIGTDNPVEKATIEGVIAVREGNAPGNTANYGKLYVQSNDGDLYFKAADGLATNLLSGGGSDNLGNHTATQDLIMGNYSLKSTEGSLTFKSEPSSATPLYTFKKNGNSAPGNSVNISLEGGSGNDRIVLKTDQNLNNSYDIQFPNANPTPGKVLKVASTSGGNPSAVMEWADALPNVSIPGSSGATGTKGQMAFDTNYFYVCVASNSWKRIAWPSW